MVTGGSPGKPSRELKRQCLDKALEVAPWGRGPDFGPSQAYFPGSQADCSPPKVDEVSERAPPRPSAGAPSRAEFSMTQHGCSPGTGPDTP